jgi:multiple sugar transport system substrate-binding protein
VATTRRRPSSSPRVKTPASSSPRTNTGATKTAAQARLLLRRNDILAKAGFPNPPTTWDELVTQAAAVNKPPLFGLGLALSNVGDGNVQMSVMQSYGGRIADDAGKTVTIKSEATRAYLAWLKGAWDKKIFPPGVTTWDGAGDNQAYLSGQAAFIANTGRLCAVCIAIAGSMPISTTL